MNYLQWAAIVLAIAAFGSLCVFVGCCVKVDRTGVGRLAAGVALICAASAVVFWWV